MTKLRVAAYCKISSDHQEQELSLEWQKSYFESYINDNSNWVLAGIYVKKSSGTQIDCRP